MRIGCLGIVIGAIAGFAIGFGYFELSILRGYLSREITGRVVGPDGRPLENARIELRTGTSQSMFELSFSHASGIATFTDENGEYRLWRVDDCLVYASKPGFVASYEVPSENGTANLELERGRSFQARVVDDPSGEPITNARVTIFDGELPDGRRSAATDAGGNFQFDDLDPSRAIEYSVQIPGRAPVPGGESVQSAERSPVVIRVPSAPVLRGRVIDLETGEPVADALLVDLEPAKYRETEIGRSSTDGTFELRGYGFDRPWTIEVRKAGWVGSRRAFELAGKRTTWKANPPDVGGFSFETVDAKAGFHGNTGQGLESSEWLAPGFVLEFGVLRACSVEATVTTKSGAPVDSYWVAVSGESVSLDRGLLTTLGIRLLPGLILGEMGPADASGRLSTRIRLDRLLPGVPYEASIHVNGVRFSRTLRPFTRPGEVAAIEWRVPDAPWACIHGSVLRSGEPALEGLGVAWKHVEAGASGFTYANRGEFTLPNVVPGTIELTITESDDKVASKSTLTVVAGDCLEYDVELAPARPK